MSLWKIVVSVVEALLTFASLIMAHPVYTLMFLGCKNEELSFLPKWLKYGLYHLHNHSPLELSQSYEIIKWLDLLNIVGWSK